MKSKNNIETSDQDASNFCAHTITHTKGQNQNQNQNPMHKDFNSNIKRSTIEFTAIGQDQTPGPAVESANIASSLDSCEVPSSTQKRSSSSSFPPSSPVLICSNLTGTAYSQSSYVGFILLHAQGMMYSKPYFCSSNQKCDCDYHFCLLHGIGMSCNTAF